MSGHVTSRETLGKAVREVWLDWARRQPEPKPSWLFPWEELTHDQQEVDRLIGEELWRSGFIAGLKLADGPEIHRADGNAVCDECQRTFYQHPYDEEILDYQDRPFVHRLCNGDLVKT